MKIKTTLCGLAYTIKKTILKEQPTNLNEQLCVGQV